MQTAESRPPPQDQPDGDGSARNGPRKSPAKRRILRKDRRQTLEVLTSDDEVNEFVETRASSYIEPSARQHLHEVKPHLRSSFETLYSPQFDAPLAAVDGRLGGRESPDDSPLSDEAGVGYDAVDGAPAKVELSLFQESVPTRADGKDESQEDELTETQTRHPAAKALDEMSRLADEILRSRQPNRRRQSPQREPTDHVDSGGDVSSPIRVSNITFMSPAWSFGAIATGRGGDEQERPSKGVPSPPNVSIASLSNFPVASPSYVAVASPPNVRVGSMSNVLVPSPSYVSVASPTSPTDAPNGAGRRSLTRKTVAFRLPAEEETLARLREAVLDKQGHQEQRAEPQLVSRGQPVRADWRGTSAAGLPPPQPPAPSHSLPPPPAVRVEDVDRPQQPSVAQQLRTLLLSSSPMPGRIAASQNQLSPSGASALSAQISLPVGSSASFAVDKHTPRRSSSLVRTGSQDFDRQKLQDLAQKQQQNARLQDPSQPQQPFRRTWSMQQQPQPSNQHQVPAYRLNNHQQQQQQQKQQKIEQQQQFQYQQQQQQIEYQKRQKQQELEYEKQQQLELQKQQQLEFQKKQQLEFQKKQQLEFQKKQQLEFQKQQLEFQKQQQLEFQKQQQLEFQKQQQLEFQKQQQLEFQKQQQRQLELENQERRPQLQRQQQQPQLPLEHPQRRQRQEQQLPAILPQSAQPPPPPVPPRRKAQEEPEEKQKDSITLQTHWGRGADLPCVDQVCKHIHLTAWEAQRHQLVVASSHYRLARHASSSASRSSLDKHKPLRLSSQSSAMS